MRLLTLLLAAFALVPASADAKAKPVRCDEHYVEGVLSWDDPGSLYAFADDLEAQWESDWKTSDLRVEQMDRWFGDKRVLVLRGAYNRGRCRVHAALVRGGDRLVPGATVVGVIYTTENPPAPTPQLDLFWIAARRMAQYGL